MKLTKRQLRRIVEQSLGQHGLHESEQITRDDFADKVQDLVYQANDSGVGKDDIRSTLEQIVDQIGYD